MSKGTPIRPVRVPDELWEAAKATAAERGETVTAVLLRALNEYVTPTPPGRR